MLRPSLKVLSGEVVRSDSQAAADKLADAVDES
jgi:hypothetical protein